MSQSRNISLAGTPFKRRAAAEQNYRVAELKRLTSEGLNLSKAAKLLGIKYSLAKTLQTLF